jgi:hypothetical protein
MRYPFPVGYFAYEDQESGGLILKNQAGFILTADDAQKLLERVKLFEQHVGIGEIAAHNAEVRAALPEGIRPPR